MFGSGEQVLREDVSGVCWDQGHRSCEGENGYHEDYVGVYIVFCIDDGAIASSAGLP